MSRLPLRAALAALLTVLPHSLRAGSPPARLPVSNVRVLIDKFAGAEDGGADYGPWAPGPIFLPVDRTGQPSAGFAPRETSALAETMRAIVQQGVAAVPDLLEHLDDRRPTRIALDSEEMIGNPWIPKRCDFNCRTEPQPTPQPGEEEQSYTPPLCGKRIPHTLTVGDLCFAALGQVVNRNYAVLESVSAAVAWSPTSSTAVRHYVRRRWQGLTPAKHRGSLVADFYAADSLERRIGACKRLAYYYPEALEPLAVEFLKQPAYDPADALQFVRYKLYAATAPGERRRLFDAYVAGHGLVARDGILIILFNHLGLLESDEKETPEPPPGAPPLQPRQALVELYGFPKTVKGEDMPDIVEPSLAERARVIAEGLTYDFRGGIDRACRDCLSGEPDDGLAEACLRRLVGRGFDDEVERFCRRRMKQLPENYSFYAETLGRLGWTPLHVAVQRRDPDRLREALARGLRPDSADRFGRTPLHVAAAAGHVELARILLDAGAAVDARDTVGKTPAQLASQEDHADVVRLLARRGCAVTDVFLAAPVDDSGRLARFLRLDKDEINRENNFGRTPLFLAAREGSLKSVAVLLRAGAEPDAEDAHGWTPLAAASAGGHAEVVAALLKGKAAPFRRDGTNGPEPLCLAASAGKADVVRLLLARGADTETEDSAMFCRPLHLAVLAGSAPTAGVLLAGGAAVNARDNHGWTPLHSAVGAGRADLVRLLLEHGADVRAPVPEDQLQPLHLAARQGNREVVELLLARHADANARTREDKSTPLHEAARAGHAEAARALLEHGAAVDALVDVPLSLDGPLLPVGLDTAENPSLVTWTQEHEPARLGPGKGMSPLHTASRYGRADVVRVLLDHKADPDAAVAETGATALHLAAANGHGEVVELLLRRGAKVDALNRGGGTPLHLALYRKRRGVVGLLLSHKANPLACDCAGTSALHYAAMSGDADLVRLLIDRGADVNARTREDAVTPLHYAASAANPGAVAALLERGASVNAANTWGETPLHRAARLSRAGAVSLLLAGKADPNATDRLGCTPLHSALATLTPDVPTVQRLLDRGADPNAKDGEGKTPLDDAKELGAAEIVEMMTQAVARRG